MSLPAFISSDPDPVDRRVLALIDELRKQLQHRVGRPRRWLGSLRRVSFARAVQASNSIEGYNASLDDVVAAVDGEPTLDADVETQLALVGYRDAMTYVLQLAQDPQAVIDEGTLKALHFMMLKHDLAKSPGRWRGGAIFVRREPSGEIVYEGPSHELVPELIGAMLEDLYDESVPALIRAATAHLNLVMIHPFRDGNGRMARCLQTLVLAREQIVAPVFSSIEEYLGRNTQAYYDVLAQVGQGGWHPRNDPRPWTRFCLTAHYRQAQTHLRRIEEAEALWSACAELAAANGLPERCAGVLYDAAFGFRLRNATYRALVERTMDEQVTPLTASRDLNALVRCGLLIPVGESRGRYYLGAPSVTNIRSRIRGSRPPREVGDPFAIASEQPQLFATDSPVQSS
jgi:Fic family protein